MVIRAQAILGLGLANSGNETIFQAFFFWYLIGNRRTSETSSRTSFAVDSDPVVVRFNCWVVFSYPWHPEDDLMVLDVYHMEGGQFPMATNVERYFRHMGDRA